jgi:1-acyl-sn-glycerol-3-phosphate acyltransferase
VEVMGDVPAGGHRLAVVNHLGYVDIPVLGSVLPAAFVSKAEVARWPLIGLLADLAGTEYVDRVNRVSAADFAGRIRTRVLAGETVLVFPEGTSTRGDGILPFKTVPFAAVAGLPGMSVLPLHIDVVEIEGKSANGSCRDLVCWHGDASFAPHAFRLLGLRGIRFRVFVGRPIPCEGADRKELARSSRERVAALGAVSTRRNRLLPGDFIWIHALP